MPTAPTRTRQHRATAAPGTFRARAARRGCLEADVASERDPVGPCVTPCLRHLPHAPAAGEKSGTFTSEFLHRIGLLDHYYAERVTA